MIEQLDDQEITHERRALMAERRYRIPVRMPKQCL
jgi:hypothetical protein